MSTPKKDRREVPRPDRYSDKTDGKLRQSIRFSPEENDLIRAASQIERLSINTWAVRILVKEAAKIVVASTPKPRK
jgi:uncharacterized protein (DUF1778 family)